MIRYHSFGPDGLILGGYTLALNENVNVLIAHRPGVMQPTVAARMLATMSQSVAVDVHIVGVLWRSVPA